MKSRLRYIWNNIRWYSYRTYIFFKSGFHSIVVSIKKYKEYMSMISRGTITIGDVPEAIKLYFKALPVSFVEGFREISDYYRRYVRNLIHRCHEHVYCPGAHPWYVNAYIAILVYKNSLKLAGVQLLFQEMYPNSPSVIEGEFKSL